ncbi:MAG: hypothetical protein WBX16_22735 [Candidatus Acidiferrales bacterium]
MSCEHELELARKENQGLKVQLESVQAHNKDLLEQSLSLQVQILALQAENETLRNQMQNPKS